MVVTIISEPNTSRESMSEVERQLEFPSEPGYYSIVQTSARFRILVVGVLLFISGLLLWTLIPAFLEGPQNLDLSRILLGLFLALVPLVFIVFIWLSRPFLIKDGMIHLMKTVKLNSGGRTRVIPLDQVSTVALIPDSRDRLQVWVTLEDGTRFRAVTMVEETEKEFARRFAEHFSSV